MELAILHAEHSLNPESLRSQQFFSFNLPADRIILLASGTCGLVSPPLSISSFTDVIRFGMAVIKQPVMEGRGLFRADEIAELRRDADNVAIRPRARIAFPVFYLLIGEQK